ncbi:MAG: hypothetical protein HOV80_34800 [Polyangiaceae bacterium]|nr:hypothetical protein [Polyangiaceae bacterium]
MTYSRDLEHATKHYEMHEFAKALAVLRVLGEDEDALSEVEQVRYAYIRGMTDLRLAALVPASEPAARESLRACARDWLDRALKRAAASPTALSADETKRAHAARTEVDDALGTPGACLPPD